MTLKIFSLYKKSTAKTYHLLVSDTTFASDHPFSFRKNLLERIKKVSTAIDYNIRDKKVQWNINREAAKTLALSGGKIDKYE